MGNWGEKDSSWTGLLMDFYVAFLYRIKFGVCLLCICQHINAKNDLFVLFLLMLVSLRLASRLHIQNVNPEPTHFLPPHPPSATRVPKEQTYKKKGVFGVCNKQYVCVSVL